ncbi:MAG: sulfotransferase domain-containing protein, partial [Pseudomonadota bacterium]
GRQRCLALRQRVLDAMAGSGAKVNFVKTHNARTKAFGIDLIPDHITRSAVYILRHPFDVAMSYARHYAVTPDQALQAMTKPTHVIAGDRAAVPQYLGVWAEHVRSWSRARGFPVLIIRYEDMLRDPRVVFAKVLEHLGFSVDVERLERAVVFSSFDELKRQEDATGFIEQSANGGAFFHSGGAGTWQGAIEAAAAARFSTAYAKTLTHHGYTV